MEGAARGVAARAAHPLRLAAGRRDVVDCGGRVGRNFAPERQDESANVFDAAVAHIKDLRKRGLNVIVAGWSDGSRERLSHVLAEHGLKSLELVSSWPSGEDRAARRAAARGDRARTGFRGAGASRSSASRTFSATGWSATASASGARRTCWPRRAALTAGDLVVHIDHGVGRFVGLKTIEAAGAPHDCLEIHYAGGDRLFLPVENLELLSRYGSETGELDKLGGAGWQSRKARLKKRVREMAGELIRVAAAAHDPARAAPHRARRPLRRVLRPLSL